MSKKWPGLNQLHALTRGKFSIHSQSIQGVIRAFIGNIRTTKELRSQGVQINYPYKDKRFYPLIWPEQAVKHKNKKVVLPMGRGQEPLILSIPEDFKTGSCRILWNGCHYELHVNSESDVSAEFKSSPIAKATVDLGQIHLAAVATDTGEALIVSGREIRSQKRLRNKMLKGIQRKQKKCKKHSRRWTKLNKAKHRHSLKQKRRIRDLRHKATKGIVEFCKKNNAVTLYVGDPRSVRQLHNGKVQNQRISQWEVGKDIDYLSYKSGLVGITCVVGTERGTSSQCPICSFRQKSPKGRNWLCKKCGFQGHRDLVGSVNMHKIAFGKKVTFPDLKNTKYLRPGNTGSSSPADTRHVATTISKILTSAKARRRSKKSSRVESYPL